MGCDIHIHLEAKYSNETEWRHISEIYMERYYELFAAMAGVRQRKEPIEFIHPRGIPSDATQPTKDDLDRWTGDGHSHSWLDREEMNCALKRAGFDENKWTTERADMFDCVRWVFWFDN